MGGNIVVDDIAASEAKPGEIRVKDAEKLMGD